ncbi:MAG: N-acetyl-gamma-glutamyl-phosphate reductase [Clostridia bacterium]|nr:N-acetyl-gamma-glutamyl-phosphate reductase [Clostridia bacterium]
MAKVFIDGSAGTTGLRIYDRLSSRKDISLITLPDELRKDVAARKEAINSADIVFLCLPDDAAKEAVTLLDNNNTVIIDTSTAHRTNPEWTYGFPELSGMRERIKNSKLIANPGCHASGFIALVKPLIEQGVLNKDVLLSCFSITGYSGGGKKMIADYQAENRDKLLCAPRQYALSQQHKHLKEMKTVTGLINDAVFCPIVADFYSGMEVSIPLFKKDLGTDIEGIKKIYKSCYNSKIVHYDEASDENGFLSALAFSGRDDMQIAVFGNDERIVVTARYDNLGKGASGSAIQNMNIVLGSDELAGLITEEI